jgi:hypothetical protein
LKGWRHDFAIAALTIATMPALSAGNRRCMKFLMILGTLRLITSRWEHHRDVFSMGMNEATLAHIPAWPDTMGMSHRGSFSHTKLCHA